MKEFVARVGQLGSMEKVKINMIQHSCTCNNDLTEIPLEDISKDINVPIDFQHELMDSDNTKSTFEINTMDEELGYKQLKENVMQEVQKKFGVEDFKLQTDQLLQERDAKNNF